MTVIVRDQPGRLRRGTILSYNGDGTVLVGLDERQTSQYPQRYNVPAPVAWSGPNGELMAGFPQTGSSVFLSQAHGGEWFISSYGTSNNTFGNSNVLGFAGSSGNMMSEFRSGRILLQTAATAGGTNHIYIDPLDGTHIGFATEAAQFDPRRSIFSHTFDTELAFTEAHRSIKGRIKRDLESNSLRNISSSTLDSHEYDDSLWTVGMEPESAHSFITSNINVRNLPLVEDREVIYEFTNINTLGFTDDANETSLYSNFEAPKTKRNSRRDIRADAFSLGLSYPNHLIEIIKGTGVDSFGNILDLNRNALPIGKKEELSFSKSPDNAGTFKKIRALHRKALAYHFEINARKRTGNDDIAQIPDVMSKKDHARDRSRFFFDVDKEGQFKINIPASSESGNIPLLTRYENASVILAGQDKSKNPNAFVRDKSGIDVFLENFANNSPVKLEPLEDVPQDRFAPPKENVPIMYGTAFHDVRTTCHQFQDTERNRLVDYLSQDFPPDSRLNDTSEVPYLADIFSETITTSGENANAGGRSGMINLDGFLSINIGANTIDRQSLWLDYAGGIVSRIGRDIRGRSYVAGFDGDIFMQVGGSSIDKATDSRFDNINDAAREATFDLRVVKADGQLTIIRLDSKGITIATPGRLELNAAGDILFRTNGAFRVEAEEIVLYDKSTEPRRVLRSGKEI